MSNIGSEDYPAINFSYEELLVELDKELSYIPAQPGDLTSTMIASRYNIDRDSALRKMKKLVRDKPGLWQIVQVVNERNQPVLALRKVSSGGNT